MMRSLNSAVAGLRTHQTKMDVIGNNIANVNTYGFKSSRAIFSDVYYQTLSSGSAPNGGVTGGTNPTQIGYGSSVATIDTLNAASGSVATDYALDVYINGEGYIVTKDADGNLQYSRLGALGFDAEGNLVDINGNFVMGFPMGTDGTPAINPDGSCDIEDLSRITVDTEILDELTGISISRTGEILGTLEGDTEISLNKGKPSWLEDIVIAEDSNLTGDVRVILEQVSYSNDVINSAWINSITSPSNSGVSGSYEFSYDAASNRITARNTNTGETYTGTYRQGQTIDLIDGNGNVGFTIETDAYGAVDSTPITMNFYSRWDLTVTGTDKGGNTVTETYEDFDIDNPPSSLRLGDVTLYFDPDGVDMENVTSMYFDYSTVSGSIYSTWLLGATITDSSTMSEGDVTILAGKGYSAKLTFGTSDANLQFLDTTALAAFLEALDEPGTYEIEAQTVAGGIQYVITNTSSTSGNTPITSSLISANGDDIEFVFGGTTYTVGTYSFLTDTLDTSGIPSDLTLDLAQITAMLDAAAAAAGTGLSGDLTIDAKTPGPGYELLIGTTVIGDVTIDSLTDELMVDIGGTDYPIGQYATGYTSGLADLVSGTIGSFANREYKSNTLNNFGSGYTIGSVSESNKIYMQIDGVTVADATYTGGSTVKLGDVTLTVDPDELLAYFGTAPGNTNYINNSVMIGNITRNEEPQWAYENNAASSSTGVGESFIIGQIVIGKIGNTAGMTQIGDSYFATSFNSGNATFWKPGLSGTGELVAGYLEMSNVDISQEFTDMITTQRGFQANTRIITVSDEMLQELVNLKR